MSPCFECGKKSHHSHHVIPSSMGGTKTVRLCEKHHGLIHGLDFSRHSLLIKQALRLRRMAGLPVGRPKYVDFDKRLQEKVKKLRKRGASYRQITMITGITKSTLGRFFQKIMEAKYERRIGV